MRTRFLRLVASALALATSATVSSAGPVDSSTWETVDRILGRPGKVLPGDIHKYGWPRSDLHVVVGSVQIEPTLALGSWGGFLKTSTDGHVMTMGDLVLLSDEVNPVIRALQAGGLDVLAIHNHLIGESPQVIYVHFGGHGPAEPLARALRGALDATKAPLAAPTTAPTAPSAAETAAFDTLQTVQFVGGRVATTGDFVLIGDEVNPVIQELQSHGIQVTALHSHMLRESPRLFFMHFWGLDDPARIALGLKAALGKIAVQ
jgi:hypothetical protein